MEKGIQVVIKSHGDGTPQPYSRVTGLPIEGVWHDEYANDLLYSYRKTRCQIV